jgi:undecaprenyl-diphosphatase
VLEDYPVTVSSMSFPSGHAANTMTSFLAFALILAAARHRRAAIAVAVGASVVVGLTRPLLGVHWPSDVLAGWLVGISWILLCDALVRRDRSAA